MVRKREIVKERRRKEKKEKMIRTRREKEKDIEKKGAGLEKSEGRG